MSQYLSLHQLYTSFQSMGFPAPMVREFVRMGRVKVRSCSPVFFPLLTTTGLGIFGFPIPTRLIDGTCLYVLLSIVLKMFCFCFCPFRPVSAPSINGGRGEGLLLFSFFYQKGRGADDAAPFVMRGLRGISCCLLILLSRISDLGASLYLHSDRSSTVHYAGRALLHRHPEAMLHSV